MSRSTRRLLAAALTTVALALLLLTGTTAYLLSVAEPGMSGVAVAALVGAALALAGLWVAHGLLDRHFDELEHLRGDLLVAAGTGTELPRYWAEPRRSADEIRRVAAAAGDAIGRHRLARTTLDARLAVVVGAAAEGLVVSTETGLVSLVSAAALARFGAGGHLVLGTSLYGVFDRRDVAEAVSRARAEGRPVQARLRTVEGEPVAVRVADLGDHAGFLISFLALDTAGEAAVYHDLALHDVPPETVPPGPDTPLDALPALALDCEATGLDVTTDRILSIGAVRLHGCRLYRHVTFDCLVNPGVKIPPRASAVHGITDALVAGAPAFAAVSERLRRLMRGTVLVGHNIGFDLALLRREAALAGIPWDDPPALDTLRLFAALRPKATQLELEAIAGELGVDIGGRHTALGDSLVAGEIYLRLIPLLADVGVRTFGEACRFAERPRHLVRAQRAAGW